MTARGALPVVGAVLVVLGAWLAKYHPAGWALAALPVGVWAALHARAWWENRRRTPPKTNK